jgi:hypothetical protein
LFTRHRGPDHPDTLKSMNNLALSYTALNRPADALKLNEEVLEIRKRVLPKDHPDTLKEMWNLAESLSQLGRGGEAIPIIDECFAKAAGQEVHPGMIPNLIMLRMDHFEKVGDAAGCRATAAKWEKLNRPDAESLYHAGCFRSVTAEVQSKTPGADAARLAKEDADRAMAWLTKAVAAGWKETAHMKIDVTLDPLRNRKDFKKLMADLEAKPPG